MKMSIVSLLCWLSSVWFVESTYDLIDATPVCYTLGLCDQYGEWGTYTSIHPNSEEKTQRTLINLARMYPDDYISSPYGLYLYGTGGPSWSYDTDGDCGTAADVPYYWLSSLNQHSRFASWDCLNCNSSCGHSTCSDPNRCAMFDDSCSFSDRCAAFVVEDTSTYGLDCSAEGLCGANLCYNDGHCSAMFDPDSWIFGIGFSPGVNGIVISYSSGYDDEITDVSGSYSIANVCHFDERIKMNSDDYDADDKYLTFLLQWFDSDNAIDKVYVVYDGVMSEMNLEYGNVNNGFFKLNFDIPDQCEPYYFIAETTTSEYYRMPESDRFMYGTAWSNWSWWAPDGTGSRPSRCEENHYYLLDDGSTWVANGGPNVPITSDSECTGCANTYGIEDYWTDLDTSGNTPNPTTASPTTPSPTTASPTTPSPTTPSPTTAYPTASDTTASETTASDTTASATTASDTTASGTTRAATTDVDTTSHSTRIFTLPTRGTTRGTTGAETTGATTSGSTGGMDSSESGDMSSTRTDSSSSTEAGGGLSSKADGGDGGMIRWVVVGSIAFVVVIAIVGVCLYIPWKKEKKKTRNERTHSSITNSKKKATDTGGTLGSSDGVGHAISHVSDKSADNINVVYDTANANAGGPSTAAPRPHGPPPLPQAFMDRIDHAASKRQSGMMPTHTAPAPPDAGTVVVFDDTPKQYGTAAGGGGAGAPRPPRPPLPQTGGARPPPPRPKRPRPPMRN